ncbi:ABC transporter substrate-binding protein [Streptomyces sp. AC495_CC817]|uniref:ABC transporter substrate-binding protein n=1 Tax=Streptomyces sp. AC495_CC817 TaxID=2823900 RepID=UPI001C26C93B|nr:extracellular solute-binding protein [Streptomyces sp. AC495_CC817]
MQRRTRLLLPLAATALLGLALTACAPGAASTGAGADVKASTDLTDEPVTLTLMSTPESGAATEATIAAFEKKHPNITVEYSQTNYDDYNQSVNLNLSGDRSPDIVLLNAVANTVKNKLVLPLDDYADLYGWDDFFPSNQLDQWRVADDGSTLGAGGALYAAPAGFSLVGAYYNKALAAELGIEAPSTLDEFTAALRTAEAAGSLPIQLGNAEGHAAFIVQLLGQGAGGADAANAWAFGHEGETFDTDANRAAAQTLVDWQKAGYLGDPTTVNGTDLQGAVDNFTAGKGLFLVDGIWDASKIGDALGDDAGFLAFPGTNTTGIGTSVAYAISTQSAHPNEAAAFLDFLRSPEASAQQFAQGFMPDDPTVAVAEDGTLQGDIVAAWAKVAEANGLVAFNNNATATMNDTLKAGTQQLIAGQTTVDAFLTAVQDDWAAAHGD